MVAHLIPNWSAGVRETYEFRTTVFTSEAGKEQRMATRMAPRRKVDFTAILRGNALRKFQGLLHNRGAQSITIPDPARRGAILTADAPAGATTLHLSEKPLWLATGVQIGLSTFDSTGAYGLSSVATVGAFSTSYDLSFDATSTTGPAVVTLASPLTEAWPAGSEVRPIITGRLPTGVTISHETADLATIGVSFDVSVPGAIPALPDMTPTIFRQREVLLAEPNWSAPPSVAYNTPYETVDYEQGRRAFFLPVDFYTRTSQFLFDGYDHDDVARVLGLFGRMKGRRGEFAMPSWTADLVPAGAVVPGSSLVVQGSHIYDDYSASKVNQAIGILTTGGNWLLRTITGLSPTSSAPGGAFSNAYDNSFDADGGGSPFTRIDVSPNFTTAVPRDQIAMICWVNICRFASDSLTVEWLTDRVARISTNISTLEFLAPEVLT